jgi:hypothetical protein
MVDKNGYHWFAMTTASQITCIQGGVWNTTPPYKGCKGDSYVYVAPAQLNEYELYTSTGIGYWYARVYDASGIGHDVARIPATSRVATQVTATFEEAWGGYDADPYLPAVYVLSNPEYWKTGVGYQAWPNSTNSQQSLIIANNVPPVNFCPQQYGSVLNWGDLRTWYSGTSLTHEYMVCNAILFMFNFLPLVEKSS